MGQAKARGTYEQRYAEGCARVAAEAAERAKKAAAAREQERQRLAQLSVTNPKAFEREKRSRMAVRAMLAYAAGTGFL